jgi:predicted transcriptional regulator
MDKRKSNINRKLLEAIRDMGICSLDDAAGEPSLQSLLRPERQELVESVRTLQSYGYIDHPVKGDVEYWRITEKGFRQLNRDGVDLDPAIWGPQAGVQ